MPECQIVFYLSQDKYGEVYLENCTDGKKTYPIIVLNPTYFNLGIHYMAEIMVHEMVHIYCNVKEIKDINYTNGYHNKNFRDNCIKFSLNCDRNDFGFSETSLSQKIIDLIDKFSRKSPLVVLLNKYTYSI